MSSPSSLITIANFSGQSKFSADFQSVLTRAVSLQALNLENMQQSQQQQQDRQTALQSLDSRFATLQNAITNLTNATGLASYTAAVSDPTVASTSLSAGAQAGSYTLEVQSLGAHAQVISSGSPQVSDPGSQSIGSGSFVLSAGGGTPVQIDPATDTLQGLANAINGNPALGVTASIVNAGNSSSPDYRISLQSTKLGPVSIDLSQGTVDSLGNATTTGGPLVSSLVTGSLASYYVQGLPTVITSDSDTITLAPGVSVNLLKTNPGSPVTINVSQSTTRLESALQSFATAYNGVVAQLAGSYGSGANALQGDSILFSAQAVMRSLNGYTGAGGSGLSYVGLELDKTGLLTFNSTEFEASAAQGISAVSQWLGDANSGFLQSAAASLFSLEDSSTGTIKNAETSIAANLAKLSNTINDEVDRINAFQQNLMAQLSQADATIFGLQNQATLFEGLFNNNNN